MNIFILDKDPVIAARMYCDKHLVKMLCELGQLLSTAHYEHDSSVKHLVYKKTHYNHPCSKWCRLTSSNYDWTYYHFIELCFEYERRYKKVHLTYKKLANLLFINPCPQGPLTEFAQAMPDEYKNEDPVIAYRQYYISDKSRFAKWQYSKIPEWFEFRMPELEYIDYDELNKMLEAEI